MGSRCNPILCLPCLNGCFIFLWKQISLYALFLSSADESFSHFPGQSMSWLNLNPKKWYLHSWTCIFTSLNNFRQMVLNLFDYQKLSRKTNWVDTWHNSWTKLKEEENSLINPVCLHDLILHLLQHLYTN